MIPEKIIKAPLVPPTEERLRLLVSNGADCIPIAQGFIDQWKLPYIIVTNNGLSELRSAFSQGELFTQQFITIDPETILMKQDAIKISKSPHEVLVSGETGTGKELIAKSMIADRKGSIKSVNCAGLPRELIESELFGYVQGAFTGGNPRGADGLMSSAADGVMFLDEIGEMPIDVQAKLLRAIQDKSIRKIGSRAEEKITCKFVCATNRDLRKMVDEGLFRKDLYARISTLELDIKPLRKRTCDIIPITESLPGGKEFLAKYKEELEGGILDLSLNVRSIQQYVIRYNVLGRLVNKTI
jgi:transcriptional regulator with PAS, ATPase and Fis domain